MHDREDIESPNTSTVTSSTTSFLFNRSQSGFDETNAYYFLDAQRQYVGSLGYAPQWNGYDYIRFDAHGASGADNSWYMPSSKYLAYGDGGIDDSQDQDVVLHEYTHALHDVLMSGGLGSAGHDEGSISEGSGDYMALSYRRTQSSFQPNHIFNWDGNGETWSGRTISSTLKYSDTTWTNAEIHDAGILWASTMMDVENSSGIGRAVSSTLLLTSYSYVTPSSSVLDHINAIFQADRNIYGGSHLNVLTSVFYNRRFFVHVAVSGTISSNTTWSNIIYVSSNVTVNNGVTLTINPNTYIFFANNSSLIVLGTLSAIGTLSQPITFNRINSSGTWGGIDFEYNGYGTLRYCDISHASTGIHLSVYGEISNCNIHDNTGDGIFASMSSAQINYNQIRNNGYYGIYALNESNPSIKGNIITGNSYAGLCYELYSVLGSSSNLASNAIRNNGTGLSIYDNSEAYFGYSGSSGSNSICNNSGFEVSATSNSYVIVQSNWWGSYPPNASEFYADGTSYIDRSSPLSSDPNPTLLKSTPLVNNLLKINEPYFSTIDWDLFFTVDLKEALQSFFSSDYKNTLILFEKKFNTEKDSQKKKYILAKISQCYSKMGDQGFIDYLNNNVRPNLSKDDELYAVTLELEYLSFLREGKIENAINNLNNIIDNYSTNKEMYKHSLFNLSFVYGKYLKDYTRAKKFLDILETNFTGDRLVLDGRILFLGENVSTIDKQYKKQNAAPSKIIKYELAENFPNPFNPTTRISYQLPKNGFVTLKVYDILGREVASLVNEDQKAGNYSIPFDASKLSSGIYIYTIRANDFIQSKKMILMK